jgi:PEP-CTERM motif-containing protein
MERSAVDLVNALASRCVASTRQAEAVAEQWLKRGFKGKKHTWSFCEQKRTWEARSREPECVRRDKTMKSRIVGLSCALLLCAPASSRADTITITVGQFQVTPTPDPSNFSTIGHLMSDRFSLTFFRPVAADVTREIFSGDVAGLQLAIRDSFKVAGTVDGRAFADSQLAATLDLLLTTPAFRIPTPQSGEIRFQTPFTISGLLILNTDGPAPFVGDIAGVGTLDVLGAPTSDGALSLRTGSLTFASPVAAPTPEPATLFTIATGLLFVGRRDIRPKRHPNARREAVS